MDWRRQGPLVLGALLIALAVCGGLVAAYVYRPRKVPCRSGIRQLRTGMEIYDEGLARSAAPLSAIDLNEAQEGE